MARLLRSHSIAGDRFFRIVHPWSEEESVVEYLWFDAKGWLLGLIKIFASGRAEIETATEAFPLSIGPFELGEFTGDWSHGAAAECSADEYFAISALVSRLDGRDRPDANQTA
ncbi:MAG TPA: hypothetical protein PK450_03850 [Paracoccaceae bacterium]|jgi:hypothetical protein|nr:hypothetical protein [Paracoccaceae bacterium]